MTHIAELDYARSLDRQDELAKFRDCFVIGEPELIYLDGNSLGRLPKRTVDVVQTIIDQQWGVRLIRSWNEGWIDVPQRIAAKIAQLIGAQAHEVALADSTSVNLYKLALAAVRARPGRRKIVTDSLNFPSDVYVLQGIGDQMDDGYRVEIVPSPDGVHGSPAGLAAAIDEETALVALSHTVFKSAYMYDMAAVTRLAHRAGALTLWDLSHAAGSVAVELNAAGADLAVGCTYKYLNGGPGAPAFLYIRDDLQEVLENPLQGWMGQANMFDFELTYRAAPGLQRFLTGTAPILSVCALEPGVDLLLEAGMARLRAKSVAQTEYLIALWEQELAPLGFVLKSPRDPERRGSHVALGHVDAWRIDQALIHTENVLPDFRAPDNIRLGVAPIYTTYEEICQTVSRIRRIVQTDAHMVFDQVAPIVT